MAHAETITVDTTSGDSTTDENCSLPEALLAAESNAAVDSCLAGAADGDNIVVPAGVYSVELSYETASGDHLTITGSGSGADGTVLSGGESVRPLEIVADGEAEVTIIGVRFQDGMADNGGGLVADGTPDVVLSIEDCAFVDNQATDYGGGLLSALTTTVSRTTFTGNSAGIWAGGAMAWPSGELVIEDSYFGENSAENGGALAVAITLVEVYRTTIHDNTATGSGGGFYGTRGGTGWFENVTFSANTAPEDQGEAIFGNATDIKAYHCTFVGRDGALITSNTQSTQADRTELNACLITGSAETAELINFDERPSLTGGTLREGGGVAFGLLDLADYGGAQMTHALPASSSAIDSGSCDGIGGPDTLVEDGRMEVREGNCDLGAYELPDSVLDDGVLEAGETCPAGGVTINYGSDQNADGTVSESEAEWSVSICNGEQGEEGDPGNDGDEGDPGQDGSEVVIEVTDVEEGEECEAGGVSVAYGVDDGEGDGTADDGELHDDEEDGTTVVCNGSAGEDGDDGSAGSLGNPGPAGQDGETTLVRVTPFEGDGACEAGGVLIETGVDDGTGGATAGNGILEAGEIYSGQRVCNADPSGAGRSSVEVTQLSSNDSRCPAGGVLIEVTEGGELTSSEVLCAVQSERGHDEDEDGCSTTSSRQVPSYLLILGAACLIGRRKRRG